MADILTSKIQVPSLPDDTLILKDAEARNDLSTALATVTGNPLNFSTRSAQKANKTVISLEPIQDLHGYDHPWPEGGGKNLLKNSIPTQTINGITWTLQSDGTVIANGTATATSQYGIPFSELSGNFYYNGCQSGGSRTTYDVYAWDDTTNTRYYKWDETTPSVTIFGPYDLQEINIPEGHNGRIMCRIYNGVTVNNIVFKPMICLSTETDPTFAPYSNICPIDGRTETSLVGTNGKESTDPDYIESNNLTIQFGEKVYGGTVELEKGTVTVDTAIVDMGDLTWGYNSSANIFRTHDLDGLAKEYSAGQLKAICSQYSNVAPKSNIGSFTEDNAFVIGSDMSSYKLLVRDNAYTDATTFAQAMSGVQLCYELATPRTITLTPNEISLLSGVNVISTDADGITLTYRDGKVATLGDLDSLNVALNDALDGKVDEVSGKGLSTNDYTDEEKAKVAEIDAKANDDGSYGDMAVGSLLMSSAVKSTDTTPFLFRPIPPLSTPYIREKLVGASMAWNQLVDKSEFPASSGIFTNNGDGSVTANGTASGSVAAYVLKTYGSSAFIAGHKYYASSNFKTNGSASTYELMLTNIEKPGKYYLNLNLYKKETVFNCGISDANHALQFVVREGATVSNLKCIPQIIDLTLAFGTTIADRIYSMEQAQAGSGIAWIKSYGFLTDDYYANDAGSIQSVCVDRKVIKDADDTVETTISLGHDVLRGVMQLDADNNLVYYGDEKTADGVIDRKFGVVDLGSLTWAYDGNIMYCNNAFSNETTAKFVDNTTPFNCISIFAGGISFNNVYMSTKGFCVSSSGKNLYCTASGYTDPAAFKTAMNGIYLVYELATPTTDQSTPFESPQYLFDGGTEEFIDYGVEQETRDVAVPVGHVTEYMGASDGTEIKDKFYLPTLPQNDGEYLLKIKKQNGVVADMSWGKGGDEVVYLPTIYSTEEREVGVWTDGKPLYQKTLSYTATSRTDNSVDVSALSIDTMADINCKFTSNGGVSFFGNVNDSTNSYHVVFNYSNGSIVLESNGAEWYPITYEFTLQYTKTTDEPGSGKWTTMGVPTVHYDDTERVIGTWFGETLYQKSYFVSSPIKGSTQIIQDANVANIEHTVKSQGSFQRDVGSYVTFESLDSYESSNFHSFLRLVKEAPSSNEIGVAYNITLSDGDISNLFITIQYTKNNS